ncbi:MAG: DeoR/GlpR family DNA-binding transcription regulator [Lachnospiraceae bacterium]|nr:DeoR/GlpR family DNA-binding transcription regulator [Lachnospiraceae bacterium]
MKNSLSAINERREKILSIINSQDETTVEYLAQALKVTTVTIRKDLDFLDSEQKILRIFGGAKRVSNTKPENENKKEISKPDPERSLIQKKMIARAASDLLDTDDVILINSSTTASHVVEYLNEKAVTIISNNINILSRKISPSTILLMTGGQVLPGRDSLSGTYTLEILKKNYATKCIIGVCGISIKGGLTSPVLEESIINQVMISQTNGMVIVIASSDKIGRDDSFYICDISKVDVLVTDEGISEADKKEFEKIGIKVVIAKDGNI